MLYLLGETLRKEEDGRRLLQDPSPYLAETGGRQLGSEKHAREGIRAILAELVVELNYLIKQESDFDYKRVFKSPKQVVELKLQVLKSYDKDKMRGRAAVFRLPK